jgi:beta-glucosidase
MTKPPLLHTAQVPNTPSKSYPTTDTTDLNVTVRSDAHTALVRQIAGASTILLKNSKQALPLAGKPIKSMAIIGLDALPPDPNCNLDQCDEGVVTVGYGSGSNSLDYVVAPVTSLTAKANSTGVTVTTSLTQDQTAAMAAAAGKDIAVVFVNA